MQIKTHRVHYGTDVVVKSVESKVQTVRAYGVAEVYRWVPAQVSISSLNRGSKLLGVIGCVKAPHRPLVTKAKEPIVPLFLPV